jgi:hypothetical protein
MGPGLRFAHPGMGGVGLRNTPTMSARRPNIAAAGADFAFALLAFVSGWAGAPATYAVLVFLGAAAVWGWTRRAALARMALTQLILNAALALALLAIVLAGAYWLGLQLRG